MPSSLMGPFIVLQIATVIAIVMFLRMFLHKQLEIGLKRIRKMDKENLEKEDMLNFKVQKLNKEYEKKIEDAERQADTLISMAKDDSKKLRENERAKVKEEAKKIITSALEERDRIFHQTKSEISRKAVDFSVKILKQVLSEKELQVMGKDTVTEAADMMVSSGKADELFKSEDKIEITTSTDLTAKDRAYILEAIEKRGAKKKNVEFLVKEGILGGLIIKVGDSIIDGSFETRIIKAAKEMKEEI